MSISGPTLVFLAGGVQGSAVVRAARRRGIPIRALVRSHRGFDVENPDMVRGDLDDPASLILAASGVTHVVLQIPTGPESEMVRRMDNALRAAQAASVHSIVLKLASASRSAPCAEPSFVANAAIETMMRGAGIPFAIVRPTMYLDNLLKPSALAEIREAGTFSPPIAAAQSIAWTSADDCGEAAVRLLERGCDGGDYRIAGPDSVTGAMLAKRLSNGLGRVIIYREQPIAAFEREVDAALGAGMGARIASKFHYFKDHPNEAHRILVKPFVSVPALAGFEPMSIEHWARLHSDRFR